jgi:hypothetical protein
VTHVDRNQHLSLVLVWFGSHSEKDNVSFDNIATAQIERERPANS